MIVIDNLYHDTNQNIVIWTWFKIIWDINEKNKRKSMTYINKNIWPMHNKYGLEMFGRIDNQNKSTWIVQYCKIIIFTLLKMNIICSLKFIIMLKS